MHLNLKGVKIVIIKETSSYMSSEELLAMYIPILTTQYWLLHVPFHANTIAAR